MKNIASRSITASSTAAFAMTFFLPFSSTRSPFEICKWTIETASSQTGRFERICFLAIAVVIAYPYLWSALLCLASALGSRFRKLENRWLHFLFHLYGGLLTTALGTTLLVIHDTWIPYWAQWAAVTAPIAVLLLMLYAVPPLPHHRSTWMIAILGFIPQIPLQFFLARSCMWSEEPFWGYLAGGIAASLACVGSLAVYLTQLPHKRRHT